jgi:mannosyltransferase
MSVDIPRDAASPAWTAPPARASRSLAAEPPHRLSPLAVAAVLAAALLPRAIEALRTPIFFDDVYTVLLARSGPAGILHVLANDVDQPLYYLFMWLVRLTGGESALWLKLPSIVFGLLTVAAVVYFGRALFDARAGLWAGLLLATNPSHVFYSQQASFPAMNWLLLTLALWSGWRWIAYDERRDALAFVLVSLAALFTYYFSAFVVGAMLLWGVVRLRRDPPRLLTWLGMGVVIAVVCAPFVPHLAWQLNRDIFDDITLRPMASSVLLDLIRKLSDNALYLTLPVLALAALPLFRGAQWRNASLLWFSVLLPVVVPFELSREGIHLFILRQWLFALPLWAILLGAGLSRLRWPGLAALIGIGLALFGARAWNERGLVEEGRLLSAVERRLEREARPDDIVVCAETHALLFLHYHMPQLTRLRLLDARGEAPFHYSDGILVVPPEWRMSEAEWRAAVARGDRWWGVRLRHQGRDGPKAAAAMESAAPGRLWQLEKAEIWAGVQAGATAR